VKGDNISTPSISFGNVRDENVLFVERRERGEREERERRERGERREREEREEK
jgi:hypothetical protein